MKKRDYEKPTMEVVELQHQNHLLQASSQSVGVEDYDVNDYYEE